MQGPKLIISVTLLGMIVGFNAAVEFKFPEALGIAIGAIMGLATGFQMNKFIDKGVDALFSSKAGTTIGCAAFAAIMGWYLGSGGYKIHCAIAGGIVGGLLGVWIGSDDETPNSEQMKEQDSTETK